jgi:hypothetical protein
MIVTRALSPQGGHSAVEPQPRVAAKDAKSHGKNAKNNILASSLFTLAILAADFFARQQESAG